MKDFKVVEGLKWFLLTFDLFCWYISKYGSLGKKNLVLVVLLGLHHPALTVEVLSHFQTNDVANNNIDLEYFQWLLGAAHI